MLAVVVLSLLPPTAEVIVVIAVIPVSDKVLHAVSYTVLALLPAVHESPGVVMLLSAGCVVLGVLVEFGQNLVPGRTFEVRDMLADVCGVGGGVLIGLLIRRTPTTVPRRREAPSGRSHCD